MEYIADTFYKKDVETTKYNPQNLEKLSPKVLGYYFGDLHFYGEISFHEKFKNTESNM